MCCTRDAPRWPIHRRRVESGGVPDSLPQGGKKDPLRGRFTRAFLAVWGHIVFKLPPAADDTVGAKDGMPVEDVASCVKYWTSQPVWRRCSARVVCLKP